MSHRLYVVDAFTDKPFGGNEDLVTGSAHCALGPYWEAKEVASCA
ncbi:hypothetical protein [Armatimonas sp.]